MTEHTLRVMWMEGALEDVMESEYQKELDRARHEIYERVGAPGLIGEGLRFMLYKGIKYIPAIAYTAYELRRNYELPTYYKAYELYISLTREQSRMLVGAYRYLRKKVKSARTLRRYERPRPFEEGWCERNVTMVVWPPEVLDLEEVREEIGRLTEGGNLLSKDDSRDREAVEKHLIDMERVSTGAKDEVIEPMNVRVDELVRNVNRTSKAWGEYLKVIRAIHHKYPDVKFYMYVMFD